MCISKEWHGQEFKHPVYQFTCNLPKKKVSYWETDRHTIKLACKVSTDSTAVTEDVPLLLSAYLHISAPTLSPWCECSAARTGSGWTVLCVNCETARHDDNAEPSREAARARKSWAKPNQFRARKSEFIAISSIVDCFLSMSLNYVFVFYL